MAETLTFQACIGIDVTCGPSFELQCLQSGSGRHCCSHTDPWVVAHDFLELHSVYCQIHSDVDSLHIQFCQARAAVPVRDSWMSQCSSSAGLQVGLKHRSIGRDFHPSGKGQKMGDGHQTHLHLFSWVWGKVLKGNGNEGSSLASGWGETKGNRAPESRGMAEQ